MNYLDLFSGIGGFRLGAEWAGMKFDKEYHSDIDEYANKVYKKHFPDSIQLGDITKIECEDLLKYGKNWIVTGGFPCQDISIAGKGAGLSGSRSGLWSEMWRIISGIRPRFAIIENVGALVNWFDIDTRYPPDCTEDMEGQEWSMEFEQYQAIATVISDFAEIGMSAEWQDIRASDMDAPHKRERIWIVGYPEQLGFQKGADVGEVSENRETSNKFSNPGETQNFVADTMCKRSAARVSGQEQGEERNTGESINSDLQGRHGRIQEWWAVEPNVGRLAHGIPNRIHRLRCLGNSIVPQIAQLLFEQIKEKI